jgi:hypothetical protein
MTQSTQIVGVQDHSQRVVVLRPSWVMIEALRKKCHVRHETEARAKIFKSITTLDCVPRIEQAPALGFNALSPDSLIELLHEYMGLNALAWPIVHRFSFANENKEKTLHGSQIGFQ